MSYSLGLFSVFLGLATLAAFFNPGWGEQFTLTWFKVTMTILVFAMAFSFLGVWEMPIPGFTGRGRPAEWAARQGAHIKRALDRLGSRSIPLLAIYPAGNPLARASCLYPQRKERKWRCPTKQYCFSTQPKTYRPIVHILAPAYSCPRLKRGKNRMRHRRFSRPIRSECWIAHHLPISDHGLCA